MKTLLADIEKHGNRLTTGDVGNRYLIQALARNGHNDIVYKMFNHNEAPGYGYQLQFGATTLTEQWDPRNGSSWNHFMMGQIDEWLFTSLAGIRQQEGSQGMKHLVIEPMLFDEMTEVVASMETLYGKVGVRCQKSADNEYVTTVLIPVGCDAEVAVPDGSLYTVGSGTWVFKNK